MMHAKLSLSSTDGTPLGGNDSAETLLLYLIDGGLAGCIFVVPFLLGGRMAVGQFLLVLLAVVVALAWAVRQAMRRHGNWRWSGAELLLLAGVAILVLQIVPLPQSVLKWLVPYTVSLLPLWSPDQAATFHLGPWSQISLTPAATRAGLTLFLAYSLLFLVTVQRIRTLDDVERILRWLALAAMLMASFGLIQFFTNNGKFFWFYEHPFSNTAAVVNGSFTNRNHFAHFLALGVGPLIWWIQHAWRSRHHHTRHHFAQHTQDIPTIKLGPGFRILAFAVVLFAILLSLSRGGALVTFVAVAIAVAVCYRAGVLSFRLVAGLAGTTLLVGLCLAIYGQEQIANRLDDFAQGNIAALDGAHGRRTIWQTTLKAIPHFWLFGSGEGSFTHVYPIFLPWRNTSKYYSHAENGYLQVTLETGLVGLVLLLIGIAVCSFWCLNSLRTSSSKRHLTCTGAVAAGLAVSVLHSVVDFVWYVPGCMAIVAILAACACRLRQMATEKASPSFAHHRLPRAGAVAITVFLLGLGIWMSSDRLGPVRAEPNWIRYLIMQRRPLDRVAIDPNIDHPSTAEEERDTLLAIEQKIADHLEEVTRWDPNHTEAHFALAASYLRLFDQLQAASSINTMPLSEISDAASRSQFASREALNEWLHRAIGPHAQLLDRALWHAWKGLTICPLEGAGYLYLGELCFLQGAPATTKTAYLAQARQVGPYDGTVLFYAGKEAARNGDLAQALTCWQQSYNCGRPYQHQLINFLVGRTAPEHLGEEIQFILQTFQPDIHILRQLFRAYQPIASADQMIALRQAYAMAATAEAAREKQDQAVSCWLEASRLYAQLGDATQQLACAQNAVHSNPNHFEARLVLASCLADQQHYAEAEAQLRWCLQRKPNHRPLEGKLHEVIQNRIRSEGQTAIHVSPEAPRR